MCVSVVQNTGTRDYMHNQHRDDKRERTVSRPARSCSGEDGNKKASPMQPKWMLDPWDGRKERQSKAKVHSPTHTHTQLRHGQGSGSGGGGGKRN